MQLFSKKFNNVDLIPTDVLEVNFYKPYKLKIGAKSRFSVSIWTIIAASAVIVLIYPFLPLVVYNLSNINTLTASQDTNEILLGNFELNPERGIDVQSSTNVQASSGEIPQGNRIVIPKIGVDIKISSFSNEKKALSQGAFRFPSTSTPDKGSNSAFSAHRYKYLPPSSQTFYLLDKLSVGDDFSIFWEGREYQYKVTKSFIVSPYAIEVLDPTNNPTVTFITCDPVFSTRERLIVRGELVGAL